MRTMVWFRGKDLRLSDHAPLRAAMQSDEVIPVFVLDPFFFSPERARELPHRMQFLLQALGALEQGLRALGSKLVLAEGKSVETIPSLVERWGVDRVYAQRWVEPFGRVRDARIQRHLGQRLVLCGGETLCEPGTLRTRQGGSYAVFTAFARAFQRDVEIQPDHRGPKCLPPLPPNLKGVSARLPTLPELGISHNPRLLSGENAQPEKRLRDFVKNKLSAYAEHRDRMDLEGTSRLSADLKFGTLSVRQVWNHAIERGSKGASEGADKFRSELLWREFTHMSLWDRPGLAVYPSKRAFRDFPWLIDEAGYDAWRVGKTGYPVVDAAARQLLGEGFVHNRARMIAASFLTKHLMVSYKLGEAHYMKYLTDGDWAQNNAGWQWSAGCGYDAQPYFRVFNPVTQGERFDPTGKYVSRWVPELKRLPARFIHRPWEAPAAVLHEAGVVLGDTYPAPIVDHGLARKRFLFRAHAYLKG